MADTWFLGGNASETCDGCTHPGVFALQRRKMWVSGLSVGVDQWTFDRVSDTDMSQLSVQDLDLGPGEGDRQDPVRFLCAATAGGSWWDAEITW